MNTLFRTITNCNDNPSFAEGQKADVAVREETILSVRDLDLDMSIGVYDHEKEKKQRVRINVDMGVCPNRNWKADDIRFVLSYEDIVTGVQDIAESGHIQLVETFAEKIAELCLSDSRALWAKVKVEKTDIYEEAGSVGVTITRLQPIAVSNNR